MVLGFLFSCSCGSDCKFKAIPSVVGSFRRAQATLLEIELALQNKSACT